MNPIDRTPRCALLLLATALASCVSYDTVLSKDFRVPKTVAVVAVVDAQKAEGSFLITGASDPYAFDTDLLTDKLTRYLVDQKLYSVVERASVQDAITEMSLSISDIFDNRAAQQKIGKLCGADHIVIARASMTDGWMLLPPTWWKYIVLELRAVDIETGLVMWAGHAGGWYMYPFSEDELLESVSASIFAELSEDMAAVEPPAADA
ncbi:MAG: hypothetical protein H6825_01070 [Planctomycetes bacterium]|nr:hypothetical protein [Planctomycetota bacterium]